MNVRFDKIPAELKDRDQWVLWRTGKVPYSVSGQPAKANEPSTWAPYLEAVRVYEAGGYEGIGYEFAADDPYVGIDLDGCRDPETKEIQSWAKEILASLDSYAEISPSESGVKVILRGTLKSDWRKVTMDAPKVSDKQPGIEVYDRGRYFTITGQRIKGQTEPQQRQSQLDALVSKFKPKAAAVSEFTSRDAIVDRARKYVATMPVAISGQRGHDVTFRVACVLVQGFLLDRDDAFAVLSEWNQGCQPPWNERELNHKLDDAARAPGDRGYLRDVPQRRWGTVRLPAYRSPEPKHKPNVTTLAVAAQRYLENLSAGKQILLESGLPDLDYAIGGGFEFGEMVILAARPSHGKSAVALQMIHQWTDMGLPALLINEEMSELALGKRTLQFASGVPQEHWRTSMPEVAGHLKSYESTRAQCYVAESCRTAEVAAQAIERAVQEHGVRCVVVDYAGLLQGEGKGRYEQVSNMSVVMKQVATSNRIVLILQCQLNREIEKRDKVFRPKSSDLRDSGQLEQDADVIIFCCWPHRLDQHNDPHTYQFFITKNRNRPINQNAVECQFNPSRQMFTYSKPENYESSFDEYNASENF